jgi:hypothetical protein
MSISGPGRGWRITSDRGYGYGVSPPAWSSTVARFAWPLAFVVVVAMVLAAWKRDGEPHPRSGPTVLSEIRALARLETARVHLEKVVEVSDHQERLHGIVEGDDTIVFVASGDAVLGVDFAKLESGDVRFDEATRTAYIELPMPEPFSVSFDEARSHVVARKTDLVAKRNEDLERRARKQAQDAFFAAAREPTLMPYAKAQAEAQLRMLAKAWGARDVIISWKEARGEVRLSTSAPSSGGL